MTVTGLPPSILSKEDAMLPITEFVLQFREWLILVIGILGGFCAHMVADKYVKGLNNRKKIIFALLIGLPAGLMTAAIMEWNAWFTVFIWCIYTMIAIFMED